MKKANFKPNRMNTVSPYMIVESVERLIDFTAKIFEAKTEYKIESENGKIMHSQINFGDSIVMAGDATEEFPAFPCSLYIYVEDCDKVYNCAIEYGCTTIMEPTTLPQAGERQCGVKDENNNIWWIATQVEELTLEEMEKRWHEK